MLSKKSFRVNPSIHPPVQNGASLAIIKNNDVIYDKWFGLANTLTKTTLNDSTLFVGSVTKIFTTLALLSELKKAGISVHAPIGELIKGLSPGLSQLTYHHLLTHTIGMADCWPAPNESNLGVYAFFQDKGDKVLFAKPGEVFSYCNIGYALAGLALEKLTGKPYPEAIHDIIQYGSYARGNHHKDSEIDLAIILNELPDPFQTRVNLIKLTWKFDTRVEPHPFDEKDIASANPVIKEILRTGIKISA